MIVAAGPAFYFGALISLKSAQITLEICFQSFCLARVIQGEDIHKLYPFRGFHSYSKA